MGDNDNTVIDTITDVLDDITESVSNLTNGIIDDISDGATELYDSLTDTPPECIRSSPEPYNENESGIAGSVGWSVGFSFIIFFATAMIVVLFRLYCCKNQCALQKDASCTKKVCSWLCTLLLPALLGMTAGLLVAYWPQDPQVSDCTKTINMFGLVTNFLAGGVSAPMIVVISIYNPNRVDIDIEKTTGIMEYEGVKFGSFDVPDFTAKSRHITDVEIDVKVTLPDTATVMQMYDEYFEDKLVLTFKLDVVYEVAGVFSGSSMGYEERITTGYREDNDANNYSLCKCKQ